MLRRKGLTEKYDCAGVYCIKIDEQIVYIGKSLNMMDRIAAHYVGIKRGSELKYRILQELQRKGKTVKFDVLYNAESEKYYNAVNEIGEKVGAMYGVAHLSSDFKKKNGYKRSVELSNEYGMYRQYYCGCVYSKAQRDREIVEKEQSS